MKPNFGGSLFLVLFLVAASVLTAEAAITIGPGPIIGTNKNPAALFGNPADDPVWHEEFQDWKATDLRALDPNDDSYDLSDGKNESRDIVAFYTREEGDNYFFRIDFFDLSNLAENGSLDCYVAIDCALGGNTTLPDGIETDTSYPWDVCIKLYSEQYNDVVLANGTSVKSNNWLGSYWRSDLDAVEFGIKRSALTNAGWNGSSPIYFQVYTTKDSTDIGGQSDITDAIGTLNRNTGGGVGLLSTAIPSTSTAGRAKYAAIAHANQSIAPRDGTQRHIYTDHSATLKPGFIRLMDSAQMLNVPINLHISGTLLMSFLWATQNPADANYPDRDGPTFVNRVRDFVTTGPGSLIGGVLAEHIMPYFEGEVNRRSIGQNNELLYHIFGINESQMGVMHVPERVIHTDTNAPWTDPNGPLKGKPFEDILAGGFEATYLDEVTHLHWWFYPQENNPGGSPYGGQWDDNNCGRWAGGQGNDEAPYHHKVHKINGVYTFMINDREDQSKFGPHDSGLNRDTRYTLLQKALSPDYAQLTLVFDDWEAFAGNSFASPDPNNNADQWDQSIRWIANHPWIEMVNLKQVLDWAKADTNWVVDHGYVYDKPMQTYEWLKRASEHSYDHWYYGSALEESFFNRTALVHDAWAPNTMKKYGDMNTPGTLIRDSWDTIESVSATNLRRLAEWSYSAMIYETAWHDEDANPDQYQSRNYQQTFNRNDGCTTSYEDTTYDPISGWATRLHGHVRKGGIFKAASDWVADIKSGYQGPHSRAFAADIDDDQLDEYVLCNNRVFLVFERWGARLTHAFLYDPTVNGGDAIAVLGASASNPPNESENEGVGNNRVSAFKDQWSTGLSSSQYVDGDFALSAPIGSSNGWTFTSSDGKVRKSFALDSNRDVLRATYSMTPDVGKLYVRFGLGPNQMDLMKNGQVHLTEAADTSYRGLRNSQGGAAFIVAGRNVGFVNNPGDADWDGRKLPLTQQFEVESTSTNWSVGLAFSQASADDLDGDGLSNTNEFALGTNHELADTDGDGMPDGYEVAYSFNPTSSADAAQDADGDGLSNAEEYIAGTHPRQSGSVFRASSILSPIEDNLSIQVPTSTGRIYRLETTPALTAAWNIVNGQTNILGSGAPHTFTTSAPDDTRFYRVRVQIP
ncbi:MAG: hypothetical protein H3C50_02765 [Kiritimatiellae bacterium]|nr:hypothetical protein [Kiritimatiellia bacterium]MCO5069058.1 hypothetical protein [Kiritimatiellia bacterium]